MTKVVAMRKASVEEVAELVSQFEIKQSLDLGVALVHVCERGVGGEVVCISGIGDTSAIIDITN